MQVTQERRNRSIPTPTFSIMNQANPPVEQLPQMGSVLSFGTETLVPDHDICRLSYYLKCCILGCGIALPINPQLVDYVHAHLLPTEFQRSIVEIAFRDLNLALLMNRVFILDEHNLLLPRGSLNTFLAFKTASSVFDITTLTQVANQSLQTHKVMLCASKWLKDYFLGPFFRYHYDNSIPGASSPFFQQNLFISAFVTLDEFDNDPAESTVACHSGRGSADATRCQCAYCESSACTYEVTTDSEMVITDEASEQETIPIVTALPIGHFLNESDNVVVATATVI
eukprot:scaffold8369_cov121-Cylindrotheca_fusiformis.AAC.7